MPKTGLSCGEEPISLIGLYFPRSLGRVLSLSGQWIGTLEGRCVISWALGLSLIRNGVASLPTSFLCVA